MLCPLATTVSPAKTAEPIEMSFGEQTPMGPMNHVLDLIHLGATWRMQLNNPCGLKESLHSACASSGHLRDCWSLTVHDDCENWSL